MAFERGIRIGEQDSRVAKVLVYCVTDGLKLRIQVCDKLIKLGTQRLFKVCPVATSMEAVMARLPEVESGVYDTS